MNDTHHNKEIESLRCAQALLNSGNTEGALEALKECASKFPNNTKILINCAKLAEQLKEFKEAARYYRAAITIKSDAPDSWHTGLAQSSIHIAENHLANGENECAKNELNAISKILPQNPTILIRYAKLAEQLCQYEEATKCYCKAIVLKKEAPAWWYVRLAQASLHIGDISAAIENYEKATSLKPDQMNWKTALQDIKSKALDGGNPLEASQNYYDEIYRKSEKYNLDGEESLYKEIWSRIITHLKNINAASVTDIGCGPGQFAQFLLEHYQIKYIGIDYSGVAIEIAKKRNLNADFYQEDALSSKIINKKLTDALICTEVLEHIDEDIKLIEKFPRGTLAICSVPSFDAFGHVRKFPDAQSVTDRYSKYFHDFKIERFTLPTKQYMYLFLGKVK